MRKSWFVVGLTLVGTMASAESARALGAGEPSSAGKGITGGALLGAEVVMSVQAAMRVQSGWAYILGGAAGAAGGGVGGYFLEQSAGPKANMFLLTGGLALLIPTTVAVLSARAYEPPPVEVQDQGPTDEPVAEPPRVGLRLHPSPAARFAPAMVTLEKGVSLSVPAVEMTPVFSQAELLELGEKQSARFSMPVFNWLF